MQRQGPRPPLRRRPHLSIDELYLASSRPPLAGDAPPSYGASDHAIVRSSWAEGVRPRGAAVALKRSNNPHYCSYMSSEQRQTTEVCEDARPRNSAHSPRSSALTLPPTPPQAKPARKQCSIGDGDHLTGRWMQTCDPRLITRPDVFAYGRAIPEVAGWYDYRICYRQSATEQLRTLQALSWSWRPATARCGRSTARRSTRGWASGRFSSSATL